MTDIKISKVRLNHLNYYLSRDSRFAEKLAEKGIKNFESKDKITPYPVTIWELAETIIKNGIDPCDLKAKTVVQWGDFVLLGGPAPSANAKAEVVATSPKPAAVEAPLPDTAPKGTGLEKLPVRLAISTLLFGALELSRFDTKHANADADRKLLEQLTERYKISLTPQTGTINA